jgi:peptidoglycan/xylan/chitin deacetylase (PgdA/CDA1 family)
MEYIDTYQELLKHKPETLRSKVRNVALGLLSGGFNVLRDKTELLRRPRIQFLYIHHIFKDEEANFELLLKTLARDHHFIGYTEAVERILKGDIDKPYVCFSSDDGLKNNVAAAALLDRYGAKACFFICPSMIGERDPEKIKEFAASRLHFPPVEFMTWEDIGQLQKQGHEIGSHTLSHINIAATPKEQLEEEITGCHRVIKERCGLSLHFAYPYGRYTDFTQWGRELTFSSGLESCASAARGCHIVETGSNINPKDLLIRRDHTILSWPLRDILFFMARNSYQADLKNNNFSAICA